MPLASSERHYQRELDARHGKTRAELLPALGTVGPFNPGGVLSISRPKLLMQLAHRLRRPLGGRLAGPATGADDEPAVNHLIRPQREYGLTGASAAQVDVVAGVAVDAWASGRAAPEWSSGASSLRDLVAAGGPSLNHLVSPQQ